MNWFDVIRYVFVPAAVAVIGWELWSGKALNRGWSVVALRSEKPGLYWLNIAVQCAAVVGILVLVGRTNL